jgi:hypothetical protein
MVQTRSHSDVIVQSWEWYERRHAGGHGPVANLALAKCEEALVKRDWETFAHWHAIFVRERCLPQIARRQSALDRQTAASTLERKPH